MIDPKVRDDFPVLKRRVNGRPIIYMDSSCMSLRPRQVIDAVTEYYEMHPVCGGRSIHELGEEVTIKVDRAREAVAHHINASPDEIVFVKNTTEAMNTIAKGFPFEKGDKVLLGGAEHNSNIVPWRQVAGTKGIEVLRTPLNDDVTISLEGYKAELEKGVRMVSMVHTSNLNGYTVPDDVIRLAHDAGALIALDGAQSAAHLPIDVKEMDVDLFAFSIHKMLGPTGVGVLYGKAEVLAQIEPLIAGGGTVVSAGHWDHDWEAVPDRFEGGLQNYAGIIGAGAAMDYLRDIGMENIHDHELALNRRATKGFEDIDDVHIFPPSDADLRGGILSFTVEGVSSHDVAMLLNEIASIMVRSGHHCVHSYFHDSPIDNTVRASFYLYNTEEEVDILIENVKGVSNYFTKEIA